MKVSPKAFGNRDKRTLATRESTYDSSQRRCLVRYGISHNVVGVVNGFGWGESGRFDFVREPRRREKRGARRGGQRHFDTIARLPFGLSFVTGPERKSLANCTLAVGSAHTCTYGSRKAVNT